MIIVSDTSPINYLILIDCIDLLPVLYESVVIPEGVLLELQRGGTPEWVRNWIESRPDWLQVRTVIVPPDPALMILGLGEREAICLAEELQDAVVVIDEESGRKEARKRGLLVTGILGILLTASANELIDLPATLKRLQQTTFRISDSLAELVLKQDARQKEAS